MTEIIPALMPKSADDLREKAGAVCGLFPLAQIDIMDGVFVPSKSWPYQHDDGLWKKLLTEVENLPHWEELEYEIDLMIDEPERHMEEWMHLAAKRYIIHVESVRDKEKLLAAPWANRKNRMLGGELVWELLFAIGTKTSVDALIPYKDVIDGVQCMGIAKIGYQGEPFDKRVVSQLHAVRKMFKEIPLAVDGGVSKETAQALRAAGATRLVSGSYLLNAEDPLLAAEALVGDDEGG